MSSELRHRCRNPRCRLKLAEPVANEHLAFCTPGCHSSFYRRRCLVCEKDLPAGPAHRKTCKSAKCRSEYRRFPHAYLYAKNVERPLRKPIKSGTETCINSERGWHWEECGGEYSLLDREGLVEARLIPVGDADRYVVRLSPGIDYGAYALSDAKRQAISLCLAQLPVELKVAARLARLNELPPDPPQNLMPWTAAYLAGIAAERLQAPPIVPDQDSGSLAAEGHAVEIPAFVRRGAA
jgi:hypothetical protein